VSLKGEKCEECERPLDDAEFLRLWQECETARNATQTLRRELVEHVKQHGTIL
jgi:hypothetical protein